jgi:uncharacterized protein (DUF1786 family)
MEDERNATGRFLLLDVGAGTLDVLWYDAGSGDVYKAVCRSPVLTVAETAQGLKGDLVVTGREMGGGAISRVLKERACHAEVVMSSSASATVHHDPERVRSYGIRVVSDEEAASLCQSGRYAHLVTGDVDPERLKKLFRGLGVPFSFDVVGICAQDHGVPPHGISHLDFRHNLFQSTLDRDASLESLLYRDDQIPKVFNRLRSIAADARTLPVKEVYVMDSGMAAVLGASLDSAVRSCKRILVMDVATSHTVAAALEDGNMAGFFEYHTVDVTVSRLEELLAALAEGSLSHEAVLAEGGHGAYIRKAFGWQAVERIVATGPKRALLTGISFTVSAGAPWGDNMMTGAVGLLEAIRRRKGWNPFSRDDQGPYRRHETRQ